MDKENKEEPKKIEVITGDGDLNISPVYEHLEVEKPKPKENKKIFIPEVKRNINSENNNDNNNNDDDENDNNNDNTDNTKNK